MRETQTHVFFYGGEFSNWYPSRFVWEGTTFNCAEQQMMYCKALTFGDDNTATRIMKATSPAVQKALGRQVSNFDDAKWAAVREELVFQGLYEKYAQNPRLKQVLLATGNKTLVEASPNDRIWGVGLGLSDPRVDDPANWRGTNLLGKLLMKVREALQNEIQTGASA